MKIKGLIFLPIVKDLRTWWLNQKIERERKRILKERQIGVRTRPLTAREMEKEMREFIMKGTYIDSDGVEQKITKLGRSMESFYLKE